MSGWIEDWKADAEAAAKRAKVRLSNRHKIDGDFVTEEEFGVREGTPTLRSREHWRGHTSQGHSVHSKQVEHFNKRVADAGISGVHYDKNGDCKIESPQAFKKYNAFRKCVDLDGNN